MREGKGGTVRRGHEESPRRKNVCRRPKALRDPARRRHEFCRENRLGHGNCAQLQRISYIGGFPTAASAQTANSLRAMRAASVSAFRRLASARAAFLSMPSMRIASMHATPMNERTDFK